MDSFKKLMASYGARRQVERKAVDTKDFEETLNDGLGLISNILYEIEGIENTKCMEHCSIENLMKSLHSYLNCNPQSDAKRNSYITAKLAAQLLKKYVDYYQERERLCIPQYLGKEAEFCACYNFKGEDKWEEILKVLCKLKSCGKINCNSFVSSVVELELPTIIVEELQRHEIVLISSYIQCNVYKKHIWEYFSKDLISHLGKMQVMNDEGYQTKLCDKGVRVLITLLQLGLGEKIAFTESVTSQLNGQILYNFVEKLIAEMSGQVLSGAEDSPSGKHFLQLNDKQWLLEESVLQKFYLLSLQSLSRSPLVSAKKALSLQLHWLQAETQPSLSVYTRNLLTAMGCELALEGISSLIHEESASWQSILMFTNVFLTHVPGAAISLKALIDGYLTKALTWQNDFLLAATFLLGRQACLLSVRTVQTVFPSYGSWFGTTFGVEAGLTVQTASNPASFSFLMNFLTDLVPSEPSLCLRVHINKVPIAPAQCSHLLTDYVSLTKTRLQDLNEAIGSGLFAFENTPTQDVEDALAYFERTGGQINRVLLDSSLFRKMQFEQHFLPALLIPELNTKSHSSRRLLIAKLHGAKKIPSSLMQEYELACQRLTSQHSSNQQKSGPISGSLLEQWQVCLEILVDAIRSGGVDPSGLLTKEAEAAFTAVTDQLKSVFHWSAGQRDSRVLQKKIVVRVLKACELIFVPPVPQYVAKSLCLPRRFVSIFLPFPHLMRQFRMAVHRLACNSTWPVQATQAAAVLACVFDIQEEETIDINCSISSDTSVDISVLGEAVGKSLKPTSQQNMLHAFMFCSFYFRLMDEGLKGSPPALFFAPTLLRLFGYLQKRLYYSNKEEVLGVSAYAWYPDAPWAPLLKEHQLNLKDWMELESSINPEQDPVEDRHLYLCDFIIQHFDENIEPEIFASSLMYTKRGCKFGNELLQCLSYLGTSGANKFIDKGKATWLLTTWMEISVNFSHQNILVAVQRLPPWMLLTSVPNTSPTSATIHSLAELINSQLKDNLSEKGFLIPEVIRMMMRALDCIPSHTRRDVLSTIINSCPPVYVSMLRFGAHLQHLVTHYLKDKSVLYTHAVDSIMKLFQPKDSGQLHSNCKWEEGLVKWSQKQPLQMNDGSLYFHMLDLGMRLTQGEVKMVMGDNGPVLPSTSTMAAFLVQEPLHCLQLLRDAARPEPMGYPAKGLSSCACVGLCLATVGVLLSLPEELVPRPGTEAAHACNQVIRLSLVKWKEVCRELVSFDALLRDVSFLRWLLKRSHAFVQCLTTESSKRNVDTSK